MTCSRTLHFKLDDQRAAREIRESGIEMTLTTANQAELSLAISELGGAVDYEAVMMTKSALVITRPSPDFVIAKAFRIMIVDHADCLHKGVTNRRTDKLKAAPQQIFT